MKIKDFQFVSKGRSTSKALAKAFGEEWLDAQFWAGDSQGDTYTIFEGTLGKGKDFDFDYVEEEDFASMLIKEGPEVASLEEEIKALEEKYGIDISYKKAELDEGDVFKLRHKGSGRVYTLMVVKISPMHKMIFALDDGNRLFNGELETITVDTLKNLGYDYLGKVNNPFKEENK